MMKPGSDVGESSSVAGLGIDPKAQDGKGAAHGVNKDNLHEESKDWVVEVYKGSMKGKSQIGE
jgi:hypothetical protein